MPKRVRAALHEQFAGWLGAHDGEDELLGYHLEQAARYRAELGLAHEQLAERAGELLGDAGGRAAARGDATAALALVQRSLALLPVGPAARVGLVRDLSAALWLNRHVDARELALSASIDAAQASGERGP